MPGLRRDETGFVVALQDMEQNSMDEEDRKWQRDEFFQIDIPTTTYCGTPLIERP
jgi:hypothetical protein